MSKFTAEDEKALKDFISRQSEESKKRVLKRFIEEAKKIIEEDDSEMQELINYYKNRVQALGLQPTAKNIIAEMQTMINYYNSINWQSASERLSKAIENQIRQCV